MAVYIKKTAAVVNRTEAIRNEANASNPSNSIILAGRKIKCKNVGEASDHIK